VVRNGNADKEVWSRERRQLEGIKLEDDQCEEKGKKRIVFEGWGRAFPRK
jgi:hypothetical protein